MRPDIGAFNLITGTASACTVSPLTGDLGKKTRHFFLGCASRWLAAVLAVVAVLAGCTVGPDYKRPELVVPTKLA